MGLPSINPRGRRGKAVGRSWSLSLEPRDVVGRLSCGAEGKRTVRENCGGNPRSALAKYSENLPANCTNRSNLSLSVGTILIPRRRLIQYHTAEEEKVVVRCRSPIGKGQGLSAQAQGLPSHHVHAFGGNGQCGLTIAPVNFTRSIRRMVHLMSRKVSRETVAR